MIKKSSLLILLFISTLMLSSLSFAHVYSRLNIKLNTTSQGSTLATFKLVSGAHTDVEISQPDYIKIANRNFKDKASSVLRINNPLSGNTICSYNISLARGSDVKFGGGSNQLHVRDNHENRCYACAADNPICNTSSENISTKDIKNGTITVYVLPVPSTKK